MGIDRPPSASPRARAARAPSPHPHTAPTEPPLATQNGRHDRHRAGACPDEIERAASPGAATRAPRRCAGVAFVSSGAPRTRATPPPASIARPPRASSRPGGRSARSRSLTSIPTFRCPPPVSQLALSSKARVGVPAKPAKAVRAVKAASPVAKMGDEKAKAASVALAVAIAVAAPAFPARADLTSDLLAKTEANKELNDKKRAATSSANFERSRTVTDGVCEFPKNFFGCEIASSNGGVKFLSDDKDIECEGTRDGKVCASKAPGSFPPVFGM